MFLTTLISYLVVGCVVSGILLSLCACGVFYIAAFPFILASVLWQKISRKSTH